MPRGSKFRLVALMSSLRVAMLAAIAVACRSEATGPAATETPTIEKAAPSTPIAAAEPADAPDWKAAFRHEVAFDAVARSVVVDVDVAPGFHVYTQGETIGKPLLLRLTEGSDFDVDGDVRYPEGITKDLPIGRSVIVEGKARVVAPIKAKNPDATAGTAAGKFRYQVCTDEACDRPRTEAFTIDVPAAPSS